MTRKTLFFQFGNATKAKKQKKKEKKTHSYTENAKPKEKNTTAIQINKCFPNVTWKIRVVRLSVKIGQSRISTSSNTESVFETTSIVEFNQVPETKKSSINQISSPGDLQSRRVLIGRILFWFVLYLWPLETLICTNRVLLNFPSTLYILPYLY